MNLATRSLIALAGLLICETAVAHCWTVVPAKSRLGFQVEQAGGTLDGSFKEYAGRFCPNGDDTPAVQVSVDLASVQTGLPELDDALRGDDFFATRQWPKGTFSASGVTPADGNDYSVAGTLHLRDASHDITVPVHFQPAPDGKSATLTASFSLQRLDYGIGQGQWADTEWVGDTVKIEIRAEMVPAAD